MKIAAIALAIVVSVVAAPAFAGEGEISQDALASLGLGGLEQMSDAEGLSVRGRSSSSFSFGASSIFAQLSDPFNPGNFIIVTDINGGRGSDENAGLGANSLSTQGPQGSSVAVQLNVQSGNPAIQVFLAQILGNAGNAANIGAAGISAATGN